MEYTRTGRGQSYTLEAIGAGLVVLTAVIFAIQATAVTPLSVSTANQHVENQERALAETALAHAAENGTLRDALLYWNPENRTFVDASGNGYVGVPPDNGFGRLLRRVFSDEQIAVNVYIGYNTSSGPKQRQLVYQGTPSDNAVAASERLVLMDGENLTGPHSTHWLNASTGFYAPDVAPNESLYNVLEVQIVAWRK